MTAPKSGNSTVPDACRRRRPKSRWARRRFGEGSRRRRLAPRRRPRNRFGKHTKYLLFNHSQRTAEPMSEATAAIPHEARRKNLAPDTTNHFSAAPSLRTPRPSPHLHRSDPIALPCTTHVAVTHLPLDRTKTSRLKSDLAKNFFAKFSTRQKYFVLVCRLFYFLKFS
jgi:hypothetical protein